MAEAAGKDKEVPDGVRPFERFPSVEDGPEGIAKPAGGKQDKAGQAQLAVERLDGHHTEPAHEEVAHERYCLEAPREKDLEENGINFVETEESYTSKASFLDGEIMPVYKEKNQTKYTFSGKRIKRGLYQSKYGILLNADCNGSANIIKKVFPNAFAGKRNSGVNVL